MQTFLTIILVVITTGFASLLLLESKDDELKLVVIGFNILAIIVGLIAVATQ